MCKIRCPLCRKRICEIIATAEGRTVIVLKCPYCGRTVVRIRCPHCGRTVRLEWLIQTSLKTK